MSLALSGWQLLPSRVVDWEHPSVCCGGWYSDVSAETPVPSWASSYEWRWWLDYDRGWRPCRRAAMSDVVLIRPRTQPSLPPNPRNKIITLSAQQTGQSCLLVLLAFANFLRPPKPDHRHFFVPSTLASRVVSWEILSGNFRKNYGIFRENFRGNFPRNLWYKNVIQHSKKCPQYHLKTT